jgi:hypothetical protein
MSKIICPRCHTEMEDNNIHEHYLWSDCVSNLQKQNATLAEQLKAAQDDAERLARSLMLWGADTSDDACDCELCKFERDALKQHEALVAQEAE